MTEHEHDDLGRELHAMRAEPRPEYARELDQRAAAWLRERPRRRLPWLRIAIPVGAAAATAAVVVGIAISGGDGDRDGTEPLDVAVVTAEAPAAGGGSGADPVLEAAPQALDNRGAREDAAPQAPPDVLALEPGSPPPGGIFIVRYEFAERTAATVALAGSEAEVEIGPGTGSLEIGTDGVPEGRHGLTISIGGVPALRERVVVGG